MGVLLVLHILSCLGLIGVILLQVGASGGLRGIFGGGMESMFGAVGGAPFLKKVTIGFAALFFGTALILASLSSRQEMASVMKGVKPAAPATVPSAPQPETPTPSE